MIPTLVAYVISFALLAGIELLFLPITAAMTLLIVTLKEISKTAKWLYPVVVPLSDGIKIFCAIMIATWLIHELGEEPSWLMFSIPGFLMIKNDLARINLAKTGNSNVRMIFEQRGEAESYNRRFDILVEKAHLVGDITGWVVGTNVFLQSATFF